jgi:hypothetical protein
MRRILSPFIFLLTAALLLSPALAHAQKPRAERPTYTLGEKWIRSDGIFELIRIEGDEYVFAAEGGREIRLTKDLAIVSVLQQGRVLWEADAAWSVKWPLEVGQWGRISVSKPQLVAYGQTSGSSTVIWQVDAYEDVQTPAGQFKAFRITHSLVSHALNGSFDAGTIVLWYAPEVKQFVRGEGRALKLGRGIVEFPSFRVVAVEQLAPAVFQLALQGVPEQARVSAERLIVAGKVTASRGVTRLSVTLNGREVWKQEDREGGKRELALNVPVQLQEGRNVVLVTAVDAGGETRQEARTLYYDKLVVAVPLPIPPTPAAQPVPSAPTPQPTPAPAKAALPPVPAAPPPPFVVALASPTDHARVEQETVGLAGMVSGGAGVGRVVIALNGVEISRQTEPTPPRALAVNLSVKLREGQNTLVVTATEAGGTTYQEVRTVHYEPSVPLTVAFRYPEDKSRVAEESSLVAAIVTASKGVASVRVTLNGAEVHQQTERTPQKSVVVTAPVTLREGANAVVLTASASDGTVRQEVRTVIYQRPQAAAVAPPPPAPPRQPTQDRWAVVVGIGGHDSADIPKLRYAVPDADAIFQVLTGPAGFKKEHVLLLTDRTERKPTLRNIRWALGTFLSRSARKDDTVVIFFAGHGAPETDPRGLERDGLAKYLIPSDADPDDL